MDWAMKFIPTKFREKQEDWFGKKGLSWHISCLVYFEKDTPKVITFLHLFDAISQDSDCVLGIIDSVFKFIGENFGNISLNIRSDNAGCYHCKSLISFIQLFAEKHHVTVARYDFCEPQTGKDICDRKISPIKRAIMQYINQRNQLFKLFHFFLIIFLKLS